MVDALRDGKIFKALKEIGNKFGVSDDIVLKALTDRFRINELQQVPVIDEILNNKKFKPEPLTRQFRCLSDPVYFQRRRSVDMNEAFGNEEVIEALKDSKNMQTLHLRITN